MVDTVSKVRIGFGIVWVGLFAYTFYLALGYTRLAQYFPLVVGAIGTLLVFAVVARDIVTTRKHRTCVPMDRRDDTATLGAPSSVSDPGIVRIKRYVAWCISFPLGAYVIGVVVASAVFIATFLAVEAKVRIVRSVLIGIATATLVFMFGDVMSLRWPRALWPLIR